MEIHCNCVDASSKAEAEQKIKAIEDEEERKMQQVLSTREGRLEIQKKRNKELRGQVLETLAKLKEEAMSSKDDTLI